MFKIIVFIFMVGFLHTNANHCFTMPPKKKQIPIYLISAHFTKNQIYFKFYGTFLQKTLRQFTKIFTQTNQSLISLVFFLTVTQNVAQTCDY